MSKRKDMLDTWNNYPVNNNPGIYIIVNKQNNHLYVGQAINLEKRKHEHFRDLKSCRHCNAYLQHAYNLYGEHSFLFVVVEYVEDVYFLNEREQYWIERVKPDYNITRNIYEPRNKPEERKAAEVLILREDENFKRPTWHAWVYGGARNPVLDVSRR